jgi:hypothetical protein
MGLATATPWLVGGSGGGTMGLATATPWLVGGSGGGTMGLATATLWFVGGNGGGTMGLARTNPGVVTKRTARTARRTCKVFVLIGYGLLRVKLCTARVTQMWGYGYLKSNHMVNLLGVLPLERP